MPARYRKSHRNPKQNANALSAQVLGLKSSQSKLVLKVATTSAEVQSESPESPRPNAQPQPRQDGGSATDTGSASCHSLDYWQHGITVGHYLLVLCLALASGVANK